jgi:hypothetical protein
MVIGKVYYLILSLALCCLVVSMWSAWFYILPTKCVSLFYGSKNKQRLFIFLFHMNRRPALGPPSLLYSGYRGIFPGLKRFGLGVEHPPLSSSKVKEKVEVYLYCPSGRAWLVVG